MIRVGFVVLLLGAALAGCSQIGKVGGLIAGTTPVVERSGPEGRQCKVFNDTGGNPFEYEAFRRELARTCEVVQLGECNSSCTMLMTLENACLLPGTRFGFHSSNLAGLANGVLSSYYRAGILERFENEWSKSERISRVTAEEAVQLDPELRICGG